MRPTSVEPVKVSLRIFGFSQNSLPMSDERREEVLYDTVETLLFTDEQKADLYARLAEKLKADTPANEALKTIQLAIHACQYPG